MSAVLKSSAHPVIAAPRIDKIPLALRERDQWCCWRLERKRQRGAWKWTKVPVQPNGKLANTTDARTWSSFRDVVRAYHDDERFAGIGFITARDPFVLIDLDHVRDPETNVIAPWAVAIIAAASEERAYVELSVSRTGFHIIGEGPQGFTGRKANDAELYCSGRFFTMTGGLAFDPDRRKLGTLAKTLDLVSTRLQIPKPVHREPGQAIRRAESPTAKVKRPYPDAWTDQRILNLALSKHNGDKLKRLLAGDISQHGNDASGADMACASLLAFWFWLDPDAIERVMRGSQLARPKWDTKRGAVTYLQYTIRATLDGKSEYYGKPRELLPRTADEQ